MTDAQRHGVVASNGRSLQPAMPPEDRNALLENIRGNISKLRARGINTVLFELPIDPELRDLPRPVQMRKASGPHSRHPASAGPCFRQKTGRLWMGCTSWIPPLKRWPVFLKTRPLARTAITDGPDRPFRKVEITENAQPARGGFAGKRAIANC